MAEIKATVFLTEERSGRSASIKYDLGKHKYKQHEKSPKSDISRLDLNHVSMCKVPSCDTSRLISNVIQAVVTHHHKYVLQQQKCSFILTGLNKHLLNPSNHSNSKINSLSNLCKWCQKSKSNKLQFNPGRNISKMHLERPVFLFNISC